VKVFYGPKCMKHYFAYLDTLKSGTLYYFNGSGFDNYLHIHAMVDQNVFIDPDSFVKKGSRIFAFKHGALKVHDLYLFIKSSLASACAAWGVPLEMSKKKFDHNKVYDFESAEKHCAEVCDYLRYDVIPLAHLFRIYHRAMWECFSMDMNLVISPAQYAIQVWSADNPYLHEVYVPHAGKEESEDRAAYYGGRVMCQQKQFESQEWSDNAMKLPYDDVDDYLILGDVNSLYPAAQLHNKYAHGKWQYVTLDEELHIRLEEINLITEEPDECILRSVYLCDVICPKDLITAFLLERDEKGSVSHTLHDKVSPLCFLAERAR